MISLRRPHPAAAAGALAAFVILCGLGIWQVERLHWKLGLIDRIQQRLAAPPVPLPTSGIAPDAWQYRRVAVDGVFHHDRESHVFGANKYGDSGWLVITPLERPDGSYVFVSRGWVPQDRKDPKTRLEGQVKGPVHIVGIVHLPWPRGLFVGPNEPAKNVWFYGDIDAMARHDGIRHYAPVFVDADATPNPGGLPIGGQTRVRLPNNHLEYAITWFALAAALLVMFVYAHARRQEPATPVPPAGEPHA
jgi:surfeit locus 1 family protein